MPAGQVIGRVSVKVLPDTDDFRRRAQKELDRIEKQLGKVTIHTKVDMDGAKKGFLEQLRKWNQQNRALDNRKIRFHATFNTGGMDEEISKAARRLQARASQRRIHFDADVQGHIAVRVELDKANLERVERDLKRWARDVSPLEVEVIPSMLAGAGSAIATRLAFLTRPRIVQIIPVLNNAAASKVATALAALSGARLVARTFERINDSLKNLDKYIPIVSAIGLGINLLGAAALTGSSNLFALASSLAQIGLAGLALPGILGGIAFGVGATVAVLRDFNDVIPEVEERLSSLQDAMSVEFWSIAEQPIRNMVDVLFPQFEAGLLRTSTALGEWFKAFSDAMTTRLDGALVGMFDDLARSIEISAQHVDSFANIISVLGSLGAGYLPSLAQWFGEINDRFSEFLTRNQETGQLNAWIDQGITQLGHLGTALFHVGGFFTGVANAAEKAGGSTLSVFADTMQRLHDVVDSPAFQVGMVNAISSAHQAMSNISAISGPAVSGFFETFANTMTTLMPLVGTAVGTLLKDVANALSQTEVQDGLIAMFTGIANGIAMLGPAIGPIGQAMGALGSIIGTLAQAFGPLLAAALIPLANAFVTLAPLIEGLIELLAGALLQVFTALGPVIGVVVAAFANLIGGGLIPALTAAIGALVPVITTLAPMIGALLVTALNALLPILPVIADLFTQIVPIIGQLAMAVLPVLMPVLTQLAAAFVQILAAVIPLIPVFLELLMAVLLPLLPVIVNLASTVVPALATAIAALVPAILPFLEAITQVVAFLMPFLAPALQFVATIISDMLVSAINGVVLVLQGFWNILAGIGNFLAAVFTGQWGAAWEAVKQIASGVWDALKGAFLILMNVGIFGLAKKVLGLLKGAWNLAWSAIKTAATSAWIGLKVAWTTFLTNLRNAPGAVLNHIKTLFKQAWDSIKQGTSFAWNAIRSLFSAGISAVVGFVRSLPGRAASAMNSLISALRGVATSAWNAARAAFTTGINNAINLVKGLPGKAKSALGNLGSTLKDAGRKLIQGFINGITGMFSSVRDKLGELTGKLTSWKGPESTDRTILIGAGQLVIEGFLEGLESRYDAVRKSLGGFTKEIGGLEVDAPGISGSRSNISSRVAGAVNGSVGSESAGKVFNYYAAPGSSSLSAEEELFKAVQRPRMVGW